MLNRIQGSVNKDIISVSFDVTIIYTNIPNELGLKSLEFSIGRNTDIGLKVAKIIYT